jgi:hypothetical protein
VLAVLPEPGPLPSWVWAVVALPVLAGCWVGWRGVRAAPRLATWWTKAQIAASACVFASLTMGVLTWLASGGMSPGFLSFVGTGLVLVTVGILVEMLAGALLVTTLLHLVRARL